MSTEEAREAPPDEEWRDRRRRAWRTFGVSLLLPCISALIIADWWFGILRFSCPALNWSAMILAFGLPLVAYTACLLAPSMPVRVLGVIVHGLPATLGLLLLIPALPLYFLSMPGLLSGEGAIRTRLQSFKVAPGEYLVPYRNGGGGAMDGWDIEIRWERRILPCLYRVGPMVYAGDGYEAELEFISEDAVRCTTIMDYPEATVALRLGD